VATAALRPPLLCFAYRKAASRVLFYATFKEALANDSGFANTVLHIHAGLLILLAARLVTRRSLGTFVPLLAVLGLELANEIVDRLNHGAWRWDDTLSDIGHTLFWPLMLSLAIRLYPLRSGIHGYGEGELSPAE
jgi:hypothetical protein